MRRSTIIAGILTITAVGFATQAFSQDPPEVRPVTLDCPGNVIVSQVSWVDTDVSAPDADTPDEAAVHLLDAPLLDQAVEEGAVDHAIVEVAGEATKDTQAAVYTDADGVVVGQVLLEEDSSGSWRASAVEVCA